MNPLTVLFPKVRAEILRLLFADPAKELHLRELARLSSLALGTLQTEVKKLTTAELLLVRRDGNRLYYRANTDHPVFPELQSLSLKTSGLGNQLRAALEDSGSVEFAFVFGSVASGAVGAGSDVDLLIIGDIGLRELSSRLRAVSETIGREINPHVVSHESFRAKLRAGDAFITNVMDAPKIWILGRSDELERLA